MILPYVVFEDITLLMCTEELVLILGTDNFSMSKNTEEILNCSYGY